MHFELKKLFSWKPFLGILLCLIIFNGFYLVRVEKTVTIPASYVASLWEKIADKADSEKLKYIQEQLDTGNYVYATDGSVDYAQYILLDKWREQLEEIPAYPDYLEQISNAASNYQSGMFRLEPDSFYYRSSRHMAEKYQAVQAVTPKFGISEGIQKATNSTVTDLLCFLLVLFAAAQIFLGDRISGVSKLLHSTKYGRWHLGFRKLLALGVTSFGIVLGFTLENILISNAYYDFGDLSRPVQSVNGLIGCNLPISIWEYCILYGVMKWAAMFLAGTLFSLFCMLSENSVFLLLFTGASAGLEYALRRQTALPLLEKWNLIAFLQPNTILRRYQDISLFGMPVTYFGSGWIVMGILWLLATTLLLTRFEHTEKEFRIPKLSFQSFRFLQKRQMHLFGYTVYFSAILQKALPLFLCFLVAVGAFAVSFSKDYSTYDTYYKYYVTKAQGEYTQETADFFTEEHERFAEISEQLEQLQEAGGTQQELAALEKQLEPEQALDDLESHVELVRQNTSQTPILFYDSGYVRLFSAENLDQWLPMIFAVLFLTLTISPMISADRQTGLIAVIAATKYGKRQYFLRKVCLCAIYGTLAFAAVTIPYLWNLAQNYGYFGLDAAIQNVRGLEQLSISATLGGCLICGFTMQLLGTILAALVMLCVSALCKRQMTAYLVNFCVFVIPVCLYGVIPTIGWYLGGNPIWFLPQALHL